MLGILSIPTFDALQMIRCIETDYQGGSIVEKGALQSSIHTKYWSPLDS